MPKRKSNMTQMSFVGVATLWVSAILMASLSYGRAHAENIREGSPKSCYFYSWVKGPGCTAEVRTEFRLQYLREMQPFVNASTPDALGWAEKKDKPEITTIGLVDGRRIIRIEYQPDEFGRKIGREVGCVMLAAETACDPEWYAPFYVVEPEMFSGTVVSGRDVAFGYIASVHYSGTGVFRTHHLYELRSEHPVLLRRVDSGRVRRQDFDCDATYEKALETLKVEAQLFRGLVNGDSEIENSDEAKRGDTAGSEQEGDESTP